MAHLNKFRNIESLTTKFFEIPKTLVLKHNLSVLAIVNGHNVLKRCISITPAVEKPEFLTFTSSLIWTTATDCFAFGFSNTLMKSSFPDPSAKCWGILEISSGIFQRSFQSGPKSNAILWWIQRTVFGNLMRVLFAVVSQMIKDQLIKLVFDHCSLTITPVFRPFFCNWSNYHLFDQIP